jgi:hypothetical protein
MSQLKLQVPSHILIFYSIVAFTFLKFICLKVGICDRVKELSAKKVENTPSTSKKPLG